MTYVTRYPEGTNAIHRSRSVDTNEGREAQLPDVEYPQFLESPPEQEEAISPVGVLLGKHTALTAEARELMTRKNHDYTSGSGDPFANFRMSTAVGISPIKGIQLRMMDKMQRVNTFAEKGELKVQGESLRDAAVDLINYTVLMYALLTENEQ